MMSWFSLNMWEAWDTNLLRKSRWNLLILATLCMRQQRSKGPHPRQRFSIATAMCSQIAVAVDGLPTHAATDLFNLSQLNRSSLIVTMSYLASDDQIAHQISENSDQQRPASCGGGCCCWSPYTGNLVEVAVGNCGCDWRSLSWMGPLRLQKRNSYIRINKQEFISKSNTHSLLWFFKSIIIKIDCI